MSFFEVHYCKSFINITYITLVLQNRVQKTHFADYEFGNILKFTRLVTELEIDIWSAYVERPHCSTPLSLRQTQCPSVLLSSHYSKLYFRGFCFKLAVQEDVCSSPPPPLLQLAVGQLSTVGPWNTENDTPRSKKKWKSQQDNRRGTITMNSNPIPTGWVTGEQKYQSSPTIVKVLHLTSRNPACGSDKGTWNSLVI